MLDLSMFDTGPASNAGVAMPVRHPKTGEPLKDDEGAQITITLIGRDSDLFGKAQREVLNQRIKAASAAGTTDFADEKADAIELLARSTLGWNGIVLDGVVLEFSVDAARKLYGRLAWLRAQADAFIADREHFFPKPALN